MSNHLSKLSLSFKKFNSATKRKTPLLICHGLFGSKQNWQTFAKRINATTECDVWIIDARNHGESPHHPVHDYRVMGNDIVDFINEHKIRDPVLLGHSMGGKAVMNVALRFPDLLSKLIVVDIAPMKLPLSREYHDYIKVMKQIHQKQFKRQIEAYDLISTVEPDVGVRHFLLTNLKKNLKKDGIYEFRIPLDILDGALDHLGEPALKDMEEQKRRSGDSTTSRFTGPTLFVTGENSPFRKPFVDNPEQIKKLFPNSVVKNIEGSGHWVQADKPEEFLTTVNAFINE